MHDGASIRTSTTLRRLSPTGRSSLVHDAGPRPEAGAAGDARWTADPPGPARARTERGCRRRADDGAPDARLRRLDRLRRHLAVGRQGLHRRRHVPRRDPRLRRRQHRQAAQAACRQGERRAARSTSSTSPAYGRWSARPPPSSARACCGTTRSPPRCRRSPRTAPGSGSGRRTALSTCRSATGSRRSRSPWSWCPRRPPPSSSSTRSPPRRCTGCWSCTGCSRTCPPPSTSARSAGSRSPVRPRTPGHSPARWSAPSRRSTPPRTWSSRCSPATRRCPSGTG